jgi:hypothetical protein
LEKADPQNPKASDDRHPIIDFSVSLNPHCNIGILKSTTDFLFPEFAVISRHYSQLLFIDPHQ